MTLVETQNEFGHFVGDEDGHRVHEFRFGAMEVLGTAAMLLEMSEAKPEPSPVDP